MQEKERHKKLFGSTDRDAAHRELEKVRSMGKGKKYPLACCRENPNDPAAPFQVWSGPPGAFVPPPHEEPPAAASPSDDQMEQLAERVAQKLAAMLLVPTSPPKPKAKAKKKGAT